VGWLELEPHAATKAKIHTPVTPLPAVGRAIQFILFPPVSSGPRSLCSLPREGQPS
jgi:hypothetical protein